MSMILAWLPPLLFSVVVENGIDQKYGMIVMSCFVLVAALILKICTGKWEDILSESGRSERQLSQEAHLPESGSELVQIMSDEEE